MVYAIKSDTSEELVQEVEQLHECLVDQCGYASYDIDVVATADNSIEITIEPGVAAPPDWAEDIQQKYCSLSKSERSRLEQRWCQPDQIRSALEEQLPQ